jgi:8-oxo-dGTP pyrophosphatase MutT (NUDIX family)
MEENFERFMVSQAAIIIRNNKCLILEFSDSPGKWGLPGGRIDKEELGEKAFYRELKEELGFDKADFIDVVDYDIYYYTRKNGERIAKCNIINLVINDSDKIIISHEHSQYKWIAEEEIGNYEFVWPNMKEMIKKGFKRYKLLKINE